MILVLRSGAVITQLHHGTGLPLHRAAGMLRCGGPAPWQPAIMHARRDHATMHGTDDSGSERGTSHLLHAPARLGTAADMSGLMAGISLHLVVPDAPRRLCWPMRRLFFILIIAVGMLGPPLSRALGHWHRSGNNRLSS